MLKWMFYTRELLRRGGVEVNRPDIDQLVQGLLQHYGWRSFYVDLTSDAAVAAWFASHSFQSKQKLDFCEDAFENAACLNYLSASYSTENGVGHLYAINKSILRDAGHVIVSLEHDLRTDCLSRFQAQKAWLAGILGSQKRIAPAAICAHVSAPNDVLLEYARIAGLSDTSSVFPTPENDKLLENLLTLPWISIDGVDPDLPIFRRSLEIPDYHSSFVKHLPSTTTLYTPFWLADVVESQPKEIWLHVPEACFYGVAELDTPVTNLISLLQDNDVLNLECSNLICYPNIHDKSSYQKGISIRKRSDNHFDISDISVDYDSSQRTNITVSLGYMYELNDSRLVRKPSPSDCSCGDPERHVYHLRAISVLNEMLSASKLEQDGQIIRVLN